MDFTLLHCYKFCMKAKNQNKIFPADRNNATDERLGALSLKIGIIANFCNSTTRAGTKQENVFWYSDFSNRPD